MRSAATQRYVDACRRELLAEQRAPAPIRRAAHLRLAAGALDDGDREAWRSQLDEVEAIEEMGR